MARSKVWWLLAVLALGGGAVVWALSGRGPTGPERVAYGAMAMGEEALIAGAIRTGQGEANRFFLEAVSVDGLRWDAETTPLKVESTLGLLGATADSDRVYALLLEDTPGRGGELAAFARKDGKRLWTSPLPRLGDEVQRQHLRKPPLCQSIVAAHGAVVAVVQDVATGILAVEADSGNARWKVGLAPEVAMGFEVGPKKVAVLSRGLNLIDLASGVAERPAEAFGAMCRTGDRLLVRQRAGLKVVALDGGEDEVLGVADSIPWIEACAAHGDGWVVAGMKGGELTMQRVAGGAITWEVALPGSGFSMLGGPSNGAAQGGGTLAERWPVVVYGTDDKGVHVDRLVVVDLADGRILATREGDGGGVRLGEGFAAGARLGSVSLLDPRGDEVTTLIAPGVEVVDTLVGAGRLWLVPGQESVAPGQHRRTVIDVRSGARIGGVGEPLLIDGRGLSGAFPRGQ